MPDWYYRYTSDDDEWDNLSEDHKIEADTSSSPIKTTYVSRRYEDESTAETELGLKNEPEYRNGPVHDSQMPGFHSGPHAIQPGNNNGGGNGVEVVVTEPVYIFGAYDFDADDWEGV